MLRCLIGTVVEDVEYDSTNEGCFTLSVKHLSPKGPQFKAHFSATGDDMTSVHMSLERIPYVATSENKEDQRGNA